MNSTKEMHSGKGRGKKLYYLLGRMTTQEHAQFREWLGSPLHCGSLQLTSMLDIILNRLSQVPPSELQASDFADLLMPGRRLERKKEQYIWVRLTKLYQEGLNYLTWKRIERSPSTQRRLLMEEVCHRGWERLIPETYEAGIRGRNPGAGVTYFEQTMALEVQYSHYLAVKGGGKGAKHLAEIQTVTNHHFLLQKLKYACAGTVEGDPAADPEQDALLQFAWEHAQTHDIHLPRVIRAYRSVFGLLRGACAGADLDRVALAEFGSLYARPSEYDPEEAMDLFVHAQNYCVLMYRRGGIEVLSLLERLYNAVLESRVAATTGLLQPSFFKNAVELMCRLGSLAWVDGFMEGYKAAIGNDPQGLTYQYCRAVVHYYKAEFAAVPRLLYGILTKLDDLDMGLGARTYLCRALWEIKDWDWLSSVLSAFGQYIRRAEELNSAQRALYQKFVHFLNLACKAMSGSPDVRNRQLGRLQTEIDRSVPSGLYQWLRLQIAAAIEA